MFQVKVIKERNNMITWVKQYKRVVNIAAGKIGLKLSEQLSEAILSHEICLRKADQEDYM
jgi:ferritin-like protein